MFFLGIKCHLTVCYLKGLFMRHTEPNLFSPISQENFMENFLLVPNPNFLHLLLNSCIQNKNKKERKPLKALFYRLLVDLLLLL